MFCGWAMIRNGRWHRSTNRFCKEKKLRKFALFSDSILAKSPEDNSL